MKEFYEVLMKLDSVKVGKKYHRLTVIRVASRSSDYNNRNISYHKVVCRCDCGKLTMVKLGKLGYQKACGCGIGKNTNFKHGMSRLKESNPYKSWESLKARCNNPKSTMYHNYGGRGIRVCDEWDSSFTVFYDWAISNGWQEGLEIDRIDVNGNYEPSNCRWVTRAQNCRNTRKSLIYTYNGVTSVLKDLFSMSPISIRYPTARKRAHMGWDIKRILEEPIIPTQRDPVTGRFI